MLSKKFDNIVIALIISIFIVFPMYEVRACCFEQNNNNNEITCNSQSIIDDAGATYCQKINN